MADPDLTFLARQIDRLIADSGAIRDDLAVLMAMVGRIDGSLTAMLQEMRATHTQIARMSDRIRKLEDAGGPAC